MDISIVIPLLNERESISELYYWIKESMGSHELTYEIIFIDDGSKDDSWDIIESLSKKDTEVKGIRFRFNQGKSQALNVGFAKAKGHVVITMDADLQDNPEEIYNLYKTVMEGEYHIVSGWKKNRKDPLTKTLPSKVFNWAARLYSGIKLHDFNCGIKAYKSEVIKSIDVYGEMHRYIPVLSKLQGFDRITEKEVKHQARKYGKTKFGASRFINGFLDLVSLWVLHKFGKRPMHFFGTFGVLMFFIGFLGAFYIGASKLCSIYHGAPTILVVNDPWFYISLTSMILGSMLFLTGFIAELMLMNNKTKNTPNILTQINIE
ncbi:glycosyltransferase family 2 protein [Ichthyobacterium seriolicida]|uniref:glycosyltransferase family 2 protein n=1 Tax=Ichthyobacterium seriolicida TaxID=242600 RepID=UPI000BBB9022|nr:glycosyltransferase family 2 protein [Ichthyobacterium seriolicida]